MKEKQEVIDVIQAMPKFEMKDVFIERDGEHVLNEKFKAVTEVGDNDILSVVTNKYQLVQFSEVFLPIINKIDELEGRVVYFNGNAIMEIYPKGDYFKMDNGQRVGLFVRNSVTTESALLVNFVIASKKWHAIIPRNVKGFRKIHVGNQKIVENFMKMVGDVKTAWKQIVNNFISHRPTKEELKKLLCEQMKFSETKFESIRDKMYEDNNRPDLWEIYLEIIRRISLGNYASDISREKEIEKVCRTMMGYAMAFAL